MSRCLARENPFRVDRVLSLRYRLDEAGWAALLARFEALGRRGALVGPHGSGKTTLLGEMEERLRTRGWRVRPFRLNVRRPRLSHADWHALGSVGPREIVSVDGAEQLGRARWALLRLACRRAGGVVVTAHRPGLLPTLHAHRVDADLLTVLVSELVGPQAAARYDLTAEFRRSGGNLRDCLRALYDRAAA